MTSSPAPRRRLLAFAAASLLGSVLPLSAAAADAYPSKPVRVVVGYAPGGATDVVARIVSARLTEQTGQSFIVDNRSGANSNVGAEIVARAPTDGYTIFFFTIAQTINASLYEKLSYDAQKDFDPIGMVVRIPNILVVNPKLPIRSLAEYVKYAKEQPNGVTFASSGIGSSIHLSGEMFKIASKSNMLHVPYRGSGPAIADLLGGQVDSMFDNTPSALPQVQAGRLRAIAITSAKRSPLLPDVPTIAESGFPGFEVQSWLAMAAPTGTPKPIIEKLNAELNKALANPDLRKRLIELAAVPDPTTPDQMRAFVAGELTRWREVIKASGAKAE